MTIENHDVLMSQLADGELASDRANELLLAVLDTPAERDKLKAHLRLRRSTVAWRTRTPGKTIPVAREHPLTPPHGHRAWRMSSLAVAACLGGLLVLAGFWAAGITRRDAGSSGITQPLAVSPARVSAEEMQQVAKVFALHESVAGPLAWYAADDQTIRLASAKTGEVAQAPIGVVIRLQSATPGSGRTVVVVCRNDESATIELPAEPGNRAALKMRLTPRTTNGKVDVQYAIAVDGASPEAPAASLSGQRNLGVAESSLGQLAMGDRMLKVDAAAWPISQERR